MKNKCKRQEESTHSMGPVVCFVALTLIAPLAIALETNGTKATPLANPPPSNTQVNVNEKSSLKTDLKSPPRSPFTPIDSWHGSLSYEVNSDFAAQQEQRQYFHTLTPEVVYKISPESSLGLATAITYDSLDNEIEKKDSAFEFEDVRFIHTYSTTVYSSIVQSQNPKIEGNPQTLSLLPPSAQAKNIKRTSLSVNTSLSLPTSAQAHYEGYLGILSSTAALSHPLVLRKLNVRSSITWSYLANTYEVSPVSLHENNDHSFAYGLGLSVVVWGPLNFQINGSVKTAHSINGDWTYRYNNSERLSATMGKWNTSLTLLNGNYAKSDRFNPFFYDEYRQITTLEVGYEL